MCADMASNPAVAAAQNADKSTETVSGGLSSAGSNLKAAGQDLLSAAANVPAAIGDPLAAATLQLGSEASDLGSSMWQGTKNMVSSAYHGTIAGIDSHVIQPLKDAGTGYAEGVGMVKDAAVDSATYVASKTTGAYHAVVEKAAAYDQWDQEGRQIIAQEVTGAYNSTIEGARDGLRSFVGTDQILAANAEQQKTIETLQNRISQFEKQASASLDDTQKATFPKPLPENKLLPTPTLPDQEAIDALMKGGSLTSNNQKAIATPEFLKNTDIVKSGTPEAKQLQELINSIDPNSKIAANGELGKDSLDAIKEIQKAAGIKVDGVVGKDTKAAIAAALLKQEPSVLVASL